MDRRKYVNYNTLSRVHSMFIEPIIERGIHFYHLIGNHDCYYKNTNRVNSFDLLFSNRLSEMSETSELFHLLEHPQEIILGDTAFAVVPWITEENKQACLDFIQFTQAPICLGHFELYGYDVLRGIKMEKGMDPNLLSKFEAVYSGHFHCAQKKGNVHYLGTQYQMTMSDLHEKKGFYIFDTKTHDLEFIENPIRLFFRFDYDEDDWQDELDSFSSENKLHGAYIRVHTINKKKESEFDKFMEALYNLNPGNVVVLESTRSLNLSFDAEDIPDEIKTQDIMSILSTEVQKGFIDKRKPHHFNKSDLLGVLTDIYDESLEL